MESTPTIEHLVAPVAPADLTDLATLLTAAVDSGAAVSFLRPLPIAQATEWWKHTLAALPSRGFVLVARDRGRLVGSVTLQPAWAPNQPHRAEVAKLLVHPQRQRRGLGEHLMRALEVRARARGFTLLTLDAKAAAPAERLYRKLGWIVAGTVPRFARDPDGPLHDAVLMYKVLDG